MSTDGTDASRKRKLEVQKQSCAKKQKSVLSNKSESIYVIYQYYECIRILLYII